MAVNRGIWCGCNLAVSFIVLAVLSACTMGPDFAEPELKPEWEKPFSPPAGEVVLSKDSEPAILWWQQFDDEVLTSLVRRLFQSNISLGQARERVVQAYARQGVIAADKMVQLGAEMGYTHAETGDDAVSMQGLAPGRTFDVYSIGAIAGWEFDLWGRTERLLEASREEIHGSYAEYHGMLVSLAAELTLSYIQARTMEARIDMVNKNIGLQEQILELAEKRYASGLTGEFDLLRAKSFLAKSRSMLPELQRQLHLAVSRINVLLGQPSRTEELPDGSLPQVPQLIGLGVPVDLVKRRPDIRKALAVYHGAVAQVGAAEAMKYPSLSLGGSFSLSSDTLSGVFDSGAFIYSLGPKLNFPLFTGGRIKSTVVVRISQAEQARLALEEKIVAALSEVENSAEGVVRSEQQLGPLLVAEEQAGQAVHLAKELYGAGLSNLSQVLESETELLGLQEKVLLARQQALGQAVSLYRALGGGWQQGPPALAGRVEGERAGE